MNKIAEAFFTPKAGLVYIALFAISIGVATFIENDFGTSAAQKLIFRARWFELLLILFSFTLLQNIIQYKMIPLRKWASLIFHASMILILIGAGVTRYFGYEGMMHIREGEAASSFVSSETYLNFRVEKAGSSYSFSEPVLFASLGKNHFDRKYSIADALVHIKLRDFIPNPSNRIVEDPKGLATIKIVIGGNSGREEFYLQEGESNTFKGIPFHFGVEPITDKINIIRRGDSLFTYINQDATRMIMATQQRDSLRALQFHPLALRALYTVSGMSFVFGGYESSGRVEQFSSDRKVKNESLTALGFDIEVNGESQNVQVLGRKGELGEPAVLKFPELNLSLSYGSKIETVPFKIGLRDFIMDRYPGTDNPSSYASEVTLEDADKMVKMDYRIYMNNILDYRGYRFFQSSFDQDEKGTYLSVNHDFWGTWISYIGYILLTLGLLIIFFQKNTRFNFLLQKLEQLRKQAVCLLLMMTFGASMAYAKNPEVYIHENHARKISRVVVQDFQGRFKPMHTLSAEILRKISKKDQLYGYLPEQIILSMLMDPETWEDAAIIHSGNHPEVLEILSCDQGLISYNRFFNEDGSYKLRDFVRSAQNMNPKDQGTFEKALIKLDEKVNIANMVFTGRMFKWFPVADEENNLWISPAEARHSESNTETSYALDFFKRYLSTLAEAYTSKNWDAADAMLMELASHQKSISGNVLPADSKIDAEIFLNKLSVFSKLRNIYALLGLGLLVYLMFSVLVHRRQESTILKLGFWILMTAFLFHTMGLGLRWYVSGHAPWSNGYESMIYIAWTTVLAGILFSARSIGGLAATCILAATILLVAGMSWLDPEITPLVPVLRSYWLTIHVSMEAGSYGFLMLGAVIGMINMLLMIASRNTNRDKIQRSILELTAISEITITAGLIMVSIGTYLGGVWANESWGRYWGWDAKETWALVTILVYAFILHMRLIPGLQSVYAFNLACLFGFATVIMTYYGVNYYLSGLHSYAAGDPVPIPPVVYNTAIGLIILSVFSYWRYRSCYPQGFRNN